MSQAISLAYRPHSSSSGNGPLRQDFRNGSHPQASDTFIALMGVTGAGKSSFIKTCCEDTDRVGIGHDLQACTSVVAVYRCRLSSSKAVYLIDTPGFDDTNRNDTEVLREIASWLTDSYQNSVKLTGIIYLHRISDVRMQGSAKRNLVMFKKLCGDQALKNVILATTMWDRVDEAEGTIREKQLANTQEFWGWMLKRGSAIKRHTNSRTSALQLIQYLCTKDEITLDLQEQMVNKGRDLNETSAGEELNRELAKEREKFSKEMQETRAQLEEAIRTKDKESIEAIEELRAEAAANIERLERNTQDLKVSMERLHEKKYADLERRFQEAFREEQIKHKAMDKLTAQYDNSQCLSVPTMEESTLGVGKVEQVRERYKETPMHIAAANGSIATIDRLRQQGQDLGVKDRFGNTPMHAAAYGGQVTMVEYLLRGGQRVGVQNKAGQTPIYAAAAGGQVAMVDYLRGRGQDVGIKDEDGRMLMHTAASNGQLAMVDHLLRLGQDIRRKDDFGWAAIHFAAFYGKVAMIDHLQRLGQDIDMKSDHGQTPIAIAARAGQVDVVEYVRMVGNLQWLNETRQF